jgi:amino acid transporter
MKSHNRAYAMALTVLGVLAALSSGLLLFLAGAATAGGTVGTHLPPWSLPWVAAINFAYAIAIIVTHCARRLRPETGRRLTRVLNWALLPAVTGGTVVGLYGLLRADRENRT